MEFNITMLSSNEQLVRSVLLSLRLLLLYLYGYIANITDTETRKYTSGTWKDST